jgi:hypothetical protein
MVGWVGAVREVGGRNRGKPRPNSQQKCRGPTMHTQPPHKGKRMLQRREHRMSGETRGWLAQKRRRGTHIGLQCLGQAPAHVRAQAQLVHEVVVLQHRVGLVGLVHARWARWHVQGVVVLSGPVPRVAADSPCTGESNDRGQEAAGSVGRGGGGHLQVGLHKHALQPCHETKETRQAQDLHQHNRQRADPGVALRTLAHVHTHTCTHVHRHTARAHRAAPPCT